MVSFTALRVKIRQPVYFCQRNALQGRIIWYDAPRFPRRKQASTKHYPVVGFPSGQREQTVNLPSSTSKVRILPPPPFILLNSLQCDFPLVGFPSGQREQTVNLPSSTSKVRILPPPPSLHVLPSLLHLRYSIFCPTGKDEKLRLRFDSSVARERCRRQRSEGRGALAPSNPSPTAVALSSATCSALSSLALRLARLQVCRLVARTGAPHRLRENSQRGQSPLHRRTFHHRGIALRKFGQAVQ